MKLYIDEVSFNDEDFIDLGYASETWEFSTDSITTPNGEISIYDCNIVDNDQWAGVELSTLDSTLNLAAYKGFNGGEAIPDITAIAFVRHPHNVWLWVYMFDENGDTVATFCGHEDLDSFPLYIKELSNTEWEMEDGLDDFDDEEDSPNNLYIDAVWCDSSYSYLDTTETWKFSKGIATTPNGVIKIDKIIDENKEGVHFSVTDSTINLSEYTRYNANIREAKIASLVVVSTSNEDSPDDTMYVELLDINDKTIISFEAFATTDSPRNYIDGLVNTITGVDEKNNKSPLTTELIPDAYEKREILTNQWRESGMYNLYPDLREYVQSLGNDSMDFYEWLFNDQELHGYFEWSLPNTYKIAFNNFLQLFFTLDD